ncbi:hypothetical protein WJX82_006203 [Trebouxia sp. C0006]
MSALAISGAFWGAQAVHLLKCWHQGVQCNISLPVFQGSHRNRLNHCPEGPSDRDMSASYQAFGTAMSALPRF